MKITILKSLILLVFFLTWDSSISRAETPDVVVQKFQQQLLSTMKEAKNLTVQQRYKILEPSVVSTFHMPLMTRIAAGDYWKQASKTQKTQLIAAFRRMSISTLATLFRNYSGEKFKTLSANKGPRQLQLIKTEMTRPNKNSIPITYISKKFSDRWYLIDVMVDSGISELKVRRSEFRGILKSEGVSGLIRVLNKKADELVNPKQ
jgi:phospholipid transport system substrate-binding protein